MLNRVLVILALMFSVIGCARARHDPSGTHAPNYEDHLRPDPMLAAFGHFLEG
jgi:hypothetical protein